jgi:hypothetical protein
VVQAPTRLPLPQMQAQCLHQVQAQSLVLLEQSRLSQQQQVLLQWQQQQQSQLHLGQQLHKFPKQKSPLLYAGGFLL